MINKSIYVIIALTNKAYTFPKCDFFSFLRNLRESPPFKMTFERV